MSSNAFAILGNEIDPRIASPASRPVVPQPDALDELPVLRDVLQHPLAQALEVPATRTERCQEAVY
jgi:hypothetical protein